jgi:hypothetical protein
LFQLRSCRILFFFFFFCTRCSGFLIL